MALVVFLASSAIPTAANAHFSGFDSVDAGEIRYDDYTQWDDSRIHGIGVWNALGNVDMLPDSTSTYTDLDIDDYAEDDGLCGYYSYEPGADDVNLNNNFYNTATTGQRRACTAHEFGMLTGWTIPTRISLWTRVRSAPPSTLTRKPTIRPTGTSYGDDHEFSSSHSASPHFGWRCGRRPPGSFGLVPL